MSAYPVPPAPHAEAPAHTAAAPAPPPPHAIKTSLPWSSFILPLLHPAYPWPATPFPPAPKAAPPPEPPFPPAPAADPPGPPANAVNVPNDELPPLPATTTVRMELMFCWVMYRTPPPPPPPFPQLLPPLLVPPAPPPPTTRMSHTKLRDGANVDVPLDVKLCTK